MHLVRIAPAALREVRGGSQDFPRPWADAGCGAASPPPPAAPLAAFLLFPGAREPAPFPGGPGAGRSPGAGPCRAEPGCAGPIRGSPALVALPAP